MTSGTGNVPSPTFAWESKLRMRGYSQIAGIDEAGRGSLAGPIVAAAVVLPPTLPAEMRGLLQDSKVLSPLQRERAFYAIMQFADFARVGSCESGELDDWGVTQATKTAMRRAVGSRPLGVDFLIVDAVRELGLGIPQLSLIRGDSLSLSVAAASIVAKVTRDRTMIELNESYPEYGFAEHKGYGTPGHLSALNRHGACPVHRTSFRPVSTMLRRSESAAPTGPQAEHRLGFSLPPGTGLTGEQLAASKLSEMGYKIIDRNHRTRHGEIDVVAVEDREVVFLEVKTRRQRSTGNRFGMSCTPVENMTPLKVRRVSRCAEAYMASSGYGPIMDWRVDFVGVDLATDGRLLDMQVIRNIEIE